MALPVVSIMRTARLEIDESSISVSSDHYGYGLYLSGSSALTLLDSQIRVTAITDESILIAGIRSSGAGMLIRNSRLIVTGNDYADAYGLLSQEDLAVRVFDSTLEVDGGDAYTYGIYAANTVSLELTNIAVTASDTANTVFGIRVTETPLTIRDSQVIASGYSSNIGIDIYDTKISPEHEITRTHIRADSPAETASPYFWGVNIYSDGRVLFNRDTIMVEPFVLIPGFGSGGGTGIVNNGATVTFQNSTINSAGEEAYLGIQHTYYTDPGTFNQLYINNSEIYTCLTEPLCYTIEGIDGSGAGFQAPFVNIGASLLWGAPVFPGYPVEKCQWVYDETYTGFGWPAMGAIPVSYFCP